MLKLLGAWGPTRTQWGCFAERRISGIEKERATARRQSWRSRQRGNGSSSGPRGGGDHLGEAAGGCGAMDGSLNGEAFGRVEELCAQGVTEIRSEAASGSQLQGESGPEFHRQAARCGRLVFESAGACGGIQALDRTQLGLL